MELRPGEFYINGESSIDVYNTIIQDRPLINAPTRKVIRGESSGRDGMLPMDTEKYNNSPMELILFSWTDHDIEYYKNRSNLYSMFNLGTYAEVIFYFDPDKIYKVMLDESEVSFENKYFYENNQVWKVNLTVYPWKEYDVINQPQKVKVTGTTLFNPTPNTSKPLFDVRAKGKVNLKINGEVFVMESLPASGIILDSEVAIAYAYNNGVMTNMNGYVRTRKYPTFKSGVNTVEWLVGEGGAVSEIMISPRWRTLV